MSDDSHPDADATDGGSQPQSLFQYVCSFGPGIVVVLTWLGAGDIVSAGVAGGNYGYALMWVMVVSLAVRYLFVSLIGKYQLCNQHGESVLNALVRIHPVARPMLGITAVVMAHIYGAYMLVGCGRNGAKLAGVLWSPLAGHELLATRVVATASSVAGLLLVFRPVYARIEVVFKVMLGVLSVSLLGTALWVGPDPAAFAKGMVTFTVPEQKGKYELLVVITGMVAAIGGSIMNLAYPFFLEQKGWKGPGYRRLQQYDFLLAVVVMVVLNLAVWTLGAELIHGQGKTVDDIDGLASLLGEVLGRGGLILFYVGVYAAVFTSLLGALVVMGALAQKAYEGPVTGDSQPQAKLESSWVYRGIVLFGFITPLAWLIGDQPNFVHMTLLGNSLQVLLIPFLAGGLWWITAQPKFIGEQYVNRLWENALMACLFLLSIYMIYESGTSIYKEFLKLVSPST